MTYDITSFHCFKRNDEVNNTYDLVYSKGEYKPLEYMDISLQPSITKVNELNKPHYTLIGSEKHIGNLYLKNVEKPLYVCNCSFIKTDLIVCLIDENKIHAAVLQGQYKTIVFDKLLYHEPFLNHFYSLIEGSKR